MRFKAVRLMAFLLLGAVVFEAAGAQGLDVGEGISLLKLGLQGGFSATDKDEDFKLYEALVVYGLPWKWQSSGGWRLDTRLDASLGTLVNGGETAVIGRIGPGLALSKAGIPLELAIGTGLTGLSEAKVGDEDFGTQLQFSSYIGVNYRFGWHLEAGYKFQHMSNGGIEDPNPGLDLHLFQLSYRF